MTASDPDAGQTLVLSAINRPGGSSFTQTGNTAQFTWTPNAGQAGNYTVTFNVSDNGTPVLSDSRSVGITVNAPANPVPSLASLSPSGATAGGAGFTLMVNGSGFVNGALVRDVALSDQAGLELAWEAYAKANAGAKQADQQAFFAAWSKLWAQQVPDNVAAERMAVEIHAPGLLRSNVPLSNLPAFGAAYSCKAGQPMQRAETDQVRIWR